MITSELTNEEYHAADGVSSSSLKTILSKSPAHLKGEVRKSQSHFDVGTAIHTALLEPMNWRDEIVRGPIDRRGNKWKDAQQDALENGQCLLVEAEYDSVLVLQETIMNQSRFSKYLKTNTAIAEQSAFWTDDETGLKCKVRPDLWIESSGIMIDVKSTQSAKPSEFMRSSHSYGYHTSAAYYMHGWEEAGGSPVNQFLILAFEKDPPYAATIFEFDDAALIAGEEQYRKALNLYYECLENDDWPGYPEGIHDLSLPNWA